MEDSYIDSGPSLVRTFSNPSASSITGVGSNTSKVTSVVYHPQMKHVLSGYADGTLMLWNFKPQLRSYRLEGTNETKRTKKGSVLSLSVSPCGNTVAGGYGDSTIRLYKVSVKSKCVEVKAHMGAVRTVDFNHDLESPSLLTASDDKTIKIWNLSNAWSHRSSSGKPAKVKYSWCIRAHNNWVRQAKFGPKDDLIASCGDDKIAKIWDYKNQRREPLRTFRGHDAPVMCLDFEPHTGHSFITADSKGVINLNDVRCDEKGGLVQHYHNAHSGVINSVKFHPSGNYVLSGCSDGSMRIWDVREGRLVYSVFAHKASVNSCTFSPDGKHFVSGGGDSLVMCWRSGLADAAEDSIDEDTDADSYEYQENVNRENHMYQAQGQYERRQEPSKNISESNTNKSNHSQSTSKPKLIGQKTQEVIRAVNRRKNQTTTTETQSSMNQAEDPRQDKVLACARALQILEKRLRMNEDKVAQLELEKTQ